MRVLIRADASVALGTGHIVRCATLADALKQQGADVSFACLSLPGNLNDWLRQRGLTVYELPPSEPSSVPGMQALFAESNAPFDWLIVDHYGIQASWEEAMRSWVRKIFVIDDLANRSHDCDVLLDQNIYANPEQRYIPWVPSICQLLLGPTYALLRPAFAVARYALQERRLQTQGQAQRLLIFLGGTDPHGDTWTALDALERLDYLNLRVDVVVGQGNPQRHRIEERCRTARQWIQFHCQTEAMADLMAQADVAITAGGTATWEKLCVGLPSVTVAVADNQIEMSQAVDTVGAHCFVGVSEAMLSTLSSECLKTLPQPFPVATAERLAAALRVLVEDAALRRRMSAQAMALVAGDGAAQVARLLFEESIAVDSV